MPAAPAPDGFWAVPIDAGSLEDHGALRREGKELALNRDGFSIWEHQDVGNPP